MWEAAAKFIEIMLGHGRLPFAVFVSCAWVVYRSTTDSPYDLEKPLTWFWLGLVFSGALIVAQLLTWVYSKTVVYVDGRKHGAEKRALEAAQHSAARARTASAQGEILALIPTLNGAQLNTVRYCRALGLKKFQAWNEDPVLWDIVKMELLVYGPDLTGAETGIYTFPDFVWEELSSKELTEEEVAEAKKHKAPWEIRRTQANQRI